EKLLNTYADKKKPLTKVRLKDNTEYSGSLGAQTEDTTVLVGWFGVPGDKLNEKTRKVAAKYIEQHRLADLLELARSKNVEIEVIDAIQKDGQTTGSESLSWKNDVVVSCTTEAGKAAREPLGQK